MRRGGRFADDQAEIVFSDVIIEQLEDRTDSDRLIVLADVVGLCANPGGKHPLSNRLVGWNTLSTLHGNHRVVYRATWDHEDDTTGLVEVLCLGPRSNDEVYDTARALVASGLLTDEEATELWDALDLLDTVAERVGLDGWDFTPEPAPSWLRDAAVKMGVLDPTDAEVMSTEEIEAAMEAGYDPDGRPNPEAAIAAALERARSGVAFTGPEPLAQRRSADRCAKKMPRAQKRCIRRRGHPGPCRSSP